jgi:hypothetical protein
VKQERDPHPDAHAPGLTALDTHAALESVRQGASSSGTAVASHDLGARAGSSRVGTHPRGVARERQLPYESSHEEHGRQHRHELDAGLPTLGPRMGCANLAKGGRERHVGDRPGPCATGQRGFVTEALRRRDEPGGQRRTIRGRA